MKLSSLALLIPMLFGSAVTSINAEENASNGMTADQLVAKANLASYYAGNDGRAKVRMIIEDNQGRKQRREFTILRKDKSDGGLQDMLVIFSRPRDVRNTAFRVARNPNGEDDRWLYLPGLDLVKRIASGDKRSSFVGAHFFYEDVSGRNPQADQHQLLEETADFYRLENTPKKPDQVEFDSYQVWISKTSWIPKKIEYKKNGKIYRRIEALKIETIAGIPTVTLSRVSDLQSGGKTTMKFVQVSYDLGLPDSIFSERALRKPPATWLKQHKSEKKS
ncbi:outer membrane lipoprotein-sorting protein [Pelagibaculum spongiae]|uniref:Outer membrane lipoprotein-sorting protein n=1 Tax=Pelagibaculum spongiae TaxID=2080658 RepID=A0A2V1GSQ6_9GAMM|nr:outer membrane lipoprotein-sorting protein [Pelagibaculum spongiae]PVZ66406.1 outer membrane lipoprotein-sorting protein [Pelagibaculum spongiae]